MGKRNETAQTIPVNLPVLEKEGTGAVDQTVPVTINGKTTVITRGVLTDVPIEVYMVLKQSGRFPDIVR